MLNDHLDCQEARIEEQVLQFDMLNEQILKMEYSIPETRKSMVEEAPKSLIDYKPY